NGKTTVLKAVAVTEETGESGQKWLVILTSDRKGEGDRSVARLTKLAKEGPGAPHAGPPKIRVGPRRRGVQVQDDGTGLALPREREGDGRPRRNSRARARGRELRRGGSGRRQEARAREARLPV